MIRLLENLWIGNSADAGNLGALRIKGVLNVAQDLRCALGWPEIEYMQVGLVDGPGNPSTAYCAAVLALVAMLKKHRTLVCCHTGSRSVAVSLMYLELLSPRGWDGWLTLLGERVPVNLPTPHEAHRAAFGTMNWRALSRIIGANP